MTTADPVTWDCQEIILFANTEIHLPETFLFHGKHTLHFNMPTSEAQADVGFGGIKAFGFCDNLLDEFESFINFLEAFVGGITDHPDWPTPISTHVPDYMVNANIRFLAEAMGYDLVRREVEKVEINPDLIQDGDFLAIMRLDGLDPIIMYGTGSHIGHSTMALRFDGELYVVESQDAWYWPTHGLQRTKWADWILQAEEADFQVVWMPLREEIRSNFDSAAAQDFFFQTEGLPYGYHNFLYGWMDTPRDNLPPFLADQFVPVMFSILEGIIPETVYIFFTEALNFHLGTPGQCDTITCIAAEAASRGMDVQDVIAIVEEDGWEYTGELPRDGLSYVCSAYVAALYKAGGLFGDNYVNAVEFTPYDIY